MVYWKPVSTRKGRLKVLVLTDKGKKSISDVKIEKIFSKRGSFEHEYAKFRIGEYYRKKGYWVTYEYKIGDGKTVDVVAEKDGKRIAIEVETGKSDAIYNIKKDMEAGFKEMICICLTHEVKTNIVSQLKETKMDKEAPEVFTLTEFLK
ncbi:MAG: hypothetical protein KKD56_08360 [Acidobacteria bacterium]|nr:hypothetical protein [Acidobacteriota bacterium]